MVRLIASEITSNKRRQKSHLLSNGRDGHDMRDRRQVLISASSFNLWCHGRPRAALMDTKSPALRPTHSGRHSHTRRETLTHTHTPRERLTHTHPEQGSHTHTQRCKHINTRANTHTWACAHIHTYGIHTYTRIHSRIQTHTRHTHDTHTHTG